MSNAVIEISASSSKLASGNVFLVGMTGVGKSTVGRHLGAALRRPFLDSDHELQRIYGKSVQDMFAEDGEAVFRQRETEVLTDLCRRQGIVVATGGGAVMAQANRDELKQGGVVIYLRSAVEVIRARIGHHRDRPLLGNDNLEEKLHKMLEQRAHLYEEVADVIVDTDFVHAPHAVQDILGRLRALGMALPERPAASSDQ